MGLFRPTVLLTAALLAAGLAGAAFAQTPDEALAELAGQVVSTGPNGETPEAASSITLSATNSLKSRP